MMVNFNQVEYSKLLEESKQRIQKRAIRGKWCCTCEYYTPEPENMPEFVTVYPECEHGSIVENTCDRYRLKGTGIRNNAWVDGIMRHFMRTK